MTRDVASMLVVVLLAAGGCATQSAQRAQETVPAGWQLVHPPDVRDERYPGGFHIRSDAPLEAWTQVAVFKTRDDCESSKITRIDDSIDKAMVEVGDQAKYQLPVRRAVNARCVRTP